VIYESRPLYQTLPAIDPSSIPTLTTEKSRKLKFIFERQLPSLFKALAERETRRNDVCVIVITTIIITIIITIIL
jgi:hypothetical protein